MPNYCYQFKLLRPLNFQWRCLLLFESLPELNFVDILGNIKLLKFIQTFNFTVFHYGANSSSQCKRYIVFVMFGMARVKWKTSLSISFFIKYVHQNVNRLRIFVYYGIKKWEIEVVLFHCKFDIFMNVINYMKKLRVYVSCI